MNKIINPNIQGFMNAGAAAAGSDFKQAVIDMVSGDSVAEFWDFSPDGSLYEEINGGTTTAASDDGVVGNVVGVNGNNATTYANNNRPTWREDAGKYSLEFHTGAKSIANPHFLTLENMGGAAGYFTCSVFLPLLMDTAEDKAVMIADRVDYSNEYSMVYQDASTAGLYGIGAGASPKLYVDDAVPSPENRNTFHDLIDDGGWHLAELRTLRADLWTDFITISGYQGAPPVNYYKGKVGSVLVIGETLRATGTNHQKILDFYADEYGISF